MNKQFLVINAESGDYESNFFAFLTDHELYTMADKYVSSITFGTGAKEYNIVWEEV